MEPSENHDDNNQPLQESTPSGPENKEPETLPPPLPAICKHPVFKLIDDELLSHILQPVQSLLVPSKNGDKLDYSMTLPNFGAALARPLSSNPEAVKLLRAQGSSDKTICGKHVTLGDVFVRCLDCDLSKSPSVIALMCVHCFERSNHKGHRIVMGAKTEKSSATCDCGDREFLNSEGFCPDHQPKEIDLEAIFENFPKNILEGFQVNIKKALYLVASLFEMGLYTKSDQLAGRLFSLGDVVLKEVLEYGVHCYTEINENFLHILGHVLQTGFLAEAGELWHNCEDVGAEENPQEVDTERSKMCKCTAAGNLLRLGSDMGKPQQELVEKVLTECIKYPKFKGFLVVEFLKYIQFQYLLGNANSTILNMKFQIFVSDNCQEIAIESPHFQNLVKVISKVFKTSNQQIGNGVDKVIWDVWNSFNYFLSSHSRITKRILQEGSFLKDLLDLLIQFQSKFFHPRSIHLGIHEHNVDYKSINANLVIEKAISQGIEKSIFLICRLFPEQKAALLKNFAVGLFIHLKLVNKTINYNESSASLSFTPGLQRVFCSLIKAFLGSNISLEGLLSMIDELIPSTKPSELADEAIQGVLKTVGMIRYLHLMHNFTSGQLWMVYYFIPGVTFQRDIMLIQMMAMISDPAGIWKKIVENFFSYNTELQKFFEVPTQLAVDDHYKQKMTVLQDFLHFLVYLMQDETCVLNLEMKGASFASEGLQLGTQQKRVVKKMVVNLLLGEYSTDLARIKSLAHALILDKDQFDLAVSEVVSVDEKTHKIRIKDEYEEEFDPFMYYMNPSCQQNITETVTAKAEKNKKIDLVAGKEYKDLPEYLKVIQRNMYQSDLPEFLKNFLIKFGEGNLIRPILKLVLLNLQVLEEGNDPVIREKVERLYLNDEAFIGRLGVIFADETLKDCKQCIEKIEARLKRIKNEANQEGDVIQEKDSLKDEQRRMAKERMNKLKEEFARKQALFANKNKEEHKNEEVLPKTECISCQYCLEDINPTDNNYGLPIYVAFTNNFYDTEAEVIFEKQSYQDLNAASWWPVVSSCNHYSHRKCFEEIYKNSRRPNEAMSMLSANKFETCCSLCKTVCNSFVCFGDGKNLTGVEEKEKKMYPELHMTLVESVENLFKGLVERLRVSHPQQVDQIQEQQNITRDALFSRAHFYFIESFHLHKQAASLEKSFTVYTHYLRSFKNEDFAGVDRENSLAELLNEQADLENLLNRVLMSNLIQGLKGDTSRENTIMKQNQAIREYLSLKSKVHPDDMLFPLQKVALALNLTKAVLGTGPLQIQNLCQALLCEKRNNLDELIQFIDDSFCSFDKFLEGSFSHVVDNADFNTRVVKYAPRSLKLPGNYAEFNSKYFLEKCAVCATYCKHLYRAICMICGEVLCEMDCKLAKRKVGNLNQHSIDHHLGLGAFVEMHNLWRSVVSIPVNIRFSGKDAYVDKLGQAVQKVLDSHRNVGTLDFKEFSLNQEFVEGIEEILVNHSMRNDVFRIALLRKMKEYDGVL